MSIRRVRMSLLYGRATGVNGNIDARYDDAGTQETASNHRSSTENNATNAWNVNFSTGNLWNNNKYNRNRIRAVTACDDSYFNWLKESVTDAYFDCLRHKMSSKQAVEYMAVADVDIPVLAHELYDRTYEIGISTCFIVKYPKYREVFAASFRDRIIHHWICLRLNPLFDFQHRLSGDVSHNCRVGFGARYSSKRVYEAVKRITCNYKKDAWIYKGDMDSFYMRIPKSLLWKKLRAFIEQWYDGHDKDLLLWLVEKVVFNSPEKNCVLNSPEFYWHNLSPSKSLFRTDPDRGIPIGNLTTQIFANFFMLAMDRKAQDLFEGLNYHYVRFVDDFLIVCDDKSAMLERVKVLEHYVETELSLKVHKDKKYCQRASHGVKYVGVYLKNGRMYLSSRTLGKMRERIVGFNRILQSGTVMLLDLLRIERVINSYLGFCKGLRTYHKRKKYINMFDKSFWKYFFVKGHYDSVRLYRQYRPVLE